MHRFTVATLALLAAPIASAQTDTYLLPLGGAVEMGLGGTNTTARGAGSLLSTPAAAAGAEREVAVSVMRWSDGLPLTQGRLTAVFPLGNALPLRPSIGLVAGGFVRDEATVGTGNDSRSEFVGGVTLAGVAGPLRMGVGAKMVRASYEEDLGGSSSASGVTFDAGVQGHFAGSALVVGLALRHYGGTSSGVVRAEPPSEIHVGASWQALTIQSDDGGAPLARLRLVGDVQEGSVRATTVNAGVEVIGFDRFAARIGRVSPLGSSTEDPSWTFGLGYAQDRFRADVAVRPSPLGNDAALLLTVASRF